MLNEDRVKLMTRMALFREKEERHSLEVNRSSRRDYLWWNILKAIICFTLAAVLILAMYLVCMLLEPGAWSTQQTVLFVVTVMILYLAGVTLSALAVYVVSDNRYDEATRKVRQYELMMKRLKWLYEKEKRK